MFNGPQTYGNGFTIAFLSRNRVALLFKFAGGQVGWKTNDVFQSRNREVFQSNNVTTQCADNTLYLLRSRNREDFRFKMMNGFTLLQAGIRFNLGIERIFSSNVMMTYDQPIGA